MLKGTGNIFEFENTCCFQTDVETKLYGRTLPWPSQCFRVISQTRVCLGPGYLPGNLIPAQDPVQRAIAPYEDQGWIYNPRV